MGMAGAPLTEHARDESGDKGTSVLTECGRLVPRLAPKRPPPPFVKDPPATPTALEPRKLLRGVVFVAGDSAAGSSACACLWVHVLCACLWVHVCGCMFCVHACGCMLVAACFVCMLVGAWLWVHGCGCMDVDAWLWVHGCGCMVVGAWLWVHAEV